MTTPACVYGTAATAVFVSDLHVPEGQRPYVALVRADGSGMDQRTPTDDPVGTRADGRPSRNDRPERRAPESLRYTVDQLLGRVPIRLRRRTDKWRLIGHLLAVVALVGLAAWWVVPLHAFAGPVLIKLAPGRGVHAGDLPSLAFLALALRSTWVASRIVRQP